MSADIPSPTRGTVLHEHTNENLLKINTYDHFSTIATIKKKIIKDLGKSLDSVGDGEGSPRLFDGLLRINKNPRSDYLFLAFDTQAHRKAALDQLLTVKGRGDTCWEESPVSEQDLKLTYKGQVTAEIARKRKRVNNDSGSEPKIPKVTAFAHLTKEEQLSRKKEHCLSVMKKILPSNVYGWNAHFKRFEGVLESPQWKGYRNHVQLSFGMTEEKIPGLGFWAGALVDGFSSIISIVHKGDAEPQSDSAATENNQERAELLTIHPLAVEVASTLMKTARAFEKEGLTVFTKETGEGFWRKAQIRHNVKGEVMIDLELDMAILESCEGAQAGLKERVERQLVSELTGPELTQRLEKLASSLSPSSLSAVSPRVVSLQYHSHSGIRSVPVETPRQLLAGMPQLTEYVSCGGAESSPLQFKLGPTTFFQVNTPALERMLESVAKAARLSPETTTLLDLCSGVGTLGICLAKYVRQVIGIELVEEAVKLANENVRLNGVSNATFHAGRVEVVLPKIISGLSELEKKNIVAILDPPRAGVASIVLKWVRGTPSISTVVYISCEQKALERDCPLLTKPPTKAYREKPFEVVKGFGVDLFPHTHHVEMIAVLQRTNPEEENRSATEEM